MSEIVIQTGSVVIADWHPDIQNRVTPIDVIVFHPDRQGNVFVGLHARFVGATHYVQPLDVEIISATAEIPPDAITATKGVLYNQDQIFELLRQSQDVPIDHPVPAALSATASTWTMDGFIESAQRSITTE